MQQRLASLIERIEKARLAYSPHHVVQLVAVSKYASLEQVQELYACGQRAFGENYIQEFGRKVSALKDLPLEWHMLGPLQHNKINKLLELKPVLLHSLHSLELAKAIDTRAKEPLNALLQVNIANEAQKSGISLEQALDTYAQISQTCKKIHLQGLMVMGPLNGTQIQSEQVFSQARDLFDKLPNAKTLSMGMSGDFELAIAYGANLVRVGSALFH
ncbi:YggS family pyridoxal phosphate enzyme [Helicobacter sp. NHP19-012]|uniref:Pyridoxal phosphate homeostasis protein n=1 Tax=Helicobacter gastrofelis TaxID=2849642 RepID=A0ABN6IAK9_9HELI|nr:MULTISPECIES: YggS family pyridoxal phosphate-dependent enzyme [unclassified Helicobacter]BCZ18640.1 YggS family pyridoxal phosphate enzyme [Helicobacter sp. NHP19-012]GMB95909.1 YggS family pyridoxal phosphate enzyme [Helicobacter sp. NHP22-001]